MNKRRQKLEELLLDLRALRRPMMFKMHGGSAHLPRITPSQWGVLMFIEQQKESTVKYVAKSLGITSSAATQLVDGLTKSGYLERETHSKDRRTVTLTLSKKSRGHVERMKKQALERFLKIFQVLNDKEFEQYFSLNKKLVQGFLTKKDL